MVEVKAWAYFTFYYCHVVCAWQVWCPLTINFIIINIRQNWSRKVLENHPLTSRFHQHLSSSWFFDGVRDAQRFSFLCCVSRFLVLVLCLVPNVAFVTEFSIFDYTLGFLWRLVINKHFTLSQNITYDIYCYELVIHLYK